MRVEKGKGVQLPPNSGEPIKAWLEEGQNIYFLSKVSMSDFFGRIRAEDGQYKYPVYWTYDPIDREVFLWPVPREAMEIFFDCAPRERDVEWENATHGTGYLAGENHD